MKYLVFILLFSASAALAGDSTAVRWTSDTTYVRGGVEYISQEALFRKVLNRYVIDVDIQGANPYEIYIGEEYDSNPCNVNADMWLFKPPIDWV